MKQTTINSEKLRNFTGKKYENGELDNNGLVQQIEHCGSYLNLMTIPQYQKKYNMSYNGVKNHRKIIVLFGVKFVMDNE
jgi:hypothetical protein